MKEVEVITGVYDPPFSETYDDEDANPCETPMERGRRR